MIFLSGRRGLDRTTHAGWRDSLTGAASTPGQVLGWAELEDGGICIAARGLLSVRSGPSTSSGHESVESGEGWRHVGWHQIERGGFDAETRTLHWISYDGAEERIVLIAPGRVPEVFRERVAASIAVEEFIPLDPAKERGPGVVISGRRDLGQRDAPMAWRASLPEGTTWQTPGIGELAEHAAARLRAEYDPSG